MYGDITRHLFIKLAERRLAPSKYMRLAVCGERVVYELGWLRGDREQWKPATDTSAAGTVAAHLAEGLLPVCEACAAEDAADRLGGFVRVACTRCFGLGVPDPGQPAEREVKHALGKCPTCLGLGYRRRVL